MKHGMTDLGYLIFMDRYAKKDPNKNLEIGDTVLAKDEHGSKFIGKVTGFEGTSVIVLDSADNVYLYSKKELDIPIETTPQQMWSRVAKAVSSVETDKDLWQGEFYKLLEDWKFVPGGRILAAAGTETKLTFYNCYVIPSSVDSKQGIFNTASYMAHLMSSGGGVGINISTLRPRYAYCSSTNGRSSGSVSWGELFSYVTGLIEQSGSRRGALMLILNDWHPDIFEFINSKRDMNRILNANISVGISDEFMEAVKNDEDWNLVFPNTQHVKYDELWDGNLENWKEHGGAVHVHETIKARDLWNAIIESAHASAEPGVWFRERTNKLSNSWYYDELICVNPCVTGDTLVAVADGRHTVPLKELAEDGNPVPVYCYDKEKGNITISIGRNPRLTGRKELTYKVTLDDGSGLKVTANHRFMLRDGSYTEAKDLNNGDSLMPFYKKLDPPKYGRTTRRWSVNDNNGNSGKYEHHYIAEYILGRELNYPDEVVHHVNEDPTDNSWDNIEIISLSEHTSLHQYGDNNVMRDKWWNRLSDAEKDEYRKKMSASLSGKNNPRYGVKLSNELKSRIGASRKNTWQSMTKEEVEDFKDSVSHGTKRAMKLKLLQQADWIITNYGVLNEDVWNSSRLEYSTETGTYINLCFTYSKMLEYYIDEDELVEDLKQLNHKVESVEYIGEEDVYNITVDKHHNLVYVTEAGEESITGIVTANCGEEPLPAHGCCNLGAINLSKYVDDSGVFSFIDLSRDVKIAIRFMDNIIDVADYQFHEIERQQKKERRIGLGTLGLAEVLIRKKLRYGSKESLEFINSVYEIIAESAYHASAELALTRGSFPAYDETLFLQSEYMSAMSDSVRHDIKKKGLRNVTLLTQAPTGTTGTMVNTSTGIEPFYFWEWTRKGRFGEAKEIVPVYEEYKDSVELPNYMVTAQDLDPEDHIKVQAAVQRWVDSAISKTCNVPNHYTVEQVKELYELMYELGCKGGTIYRDGSRNEQVLSIDNTEETPSPKWRSRPISLTGKTYRKETPAGTLYLTVNDREDGPFEVFLNIGKAGSELAAQSEGLGRLISYILRMPSHLSPEERLTDIIGQLNYIGSGRPLGFGPNRVGSLPDAISQILSDYLELNFPVIGHLPEGETDNGGGDLCPSCGNASFFNIEGCKKCFDCGYSEC